MNWRLDWMKMRNDLPGWRLTSPAVSKSLFPSRIKPMEAFMV
jgi:hypothetical protein